MKFILDNWDLIFQIIGMVATAGTGTVCLLSRYPWAKWIVNVADWVSVVNTAENKAKLASYVAKKGK